MWAILKLFLPFNIPKLPSITINRSSSHCFISFYYELNQTVKLSLEREALEARKRSRIMGSNDYAMEQQHANRNHAGWTICVHAFADLSDVPPVVFLYLLKESYVYGTCKATKKFRVLQQQVHMALHNSPPPGAATFIVHCLYLLPWFESYAEGFCHLIISALRRYLKAGSSPADLLEAKGLAAQLILDAIRGSVSYDEKIVLKLLDVFDIGLIDIERVLLKVEVKDNSSLDAAKTFMEKYIFRMVESHSYMTAVNLLEHFSIRQSGDSFLLKLVEENQYKAAERWAIFMGKSMLCLLVQEYLDLNLLKNAYEVLKKNNLRNEFPEVYQKCKESSIKKLAEKGCWDIAELKTNKDPQLVQYLVLLAMEAGYSEKVDELSKRYSLEGYVESKEPEIRLLQSKYLHLNELLIEKIVWVDEATALRDATCHIERSKVVGLDCEWKPNYVKGSKPNKVSIMQISSERIVFILDLIKLHKDAPDDLDYCLTRILNSSRILKLGYNFQCDTHQLASSYGDLKCFQHYEMLLDMQNVFKEHQGGLSGLAEKVLGTGLNKTRRNSNWEQRPLNQNQLEYAALDAAVLVHIFGDHSHSGNASEGYEGVEWKSHLVPHMDNKKAKRKSKSKTENEAGER